MNIKKSAAAKVLAYAISLLLMKGLSLLMLPVMANYLDVSQLGKLELIASIGALLGILSSAAIHEHLYRFAGALEVGPQRFQLASSLATLSFSWGLLVALLGSGCLLLPDSWWLVSPISRGEAACLFLAIGLEGPVSLQLAWLRMNDRVTTFFTFSVGTTLLQLTLILGVLFYSPSVVGVLLAGTATRWVQIFVLQATNRFPIIWPDSLRVITNYSAPLMLSGLVAFGLNGAERWFIAYSTDFATLGYYAIAAKFALAMCILVQPFGMWWMPKRFHMLSVDGPLKAVQTTQLGLTYVLALACFVMFSGQLYIQLALPSSFLAAQKLLIATIAVVIFKEMSELLNLSLLAEKKTDWLFKLNLTTTSLACGLCFIVADYGLYAILVVMGIAQALRCLGVIVLGQQLKPLPYNVKGLIILLIMTALSLIIAWYVTQTLTLLALSVAMPISLLLISARISYIKLPTDHPLQVRFWRQWFNTLKTS
jgi:O-antigen/teichoic acid export membrane protein